MKMTDANEVNESLDKWLAAKIPHKSNTKYKTG